MTAIQLLLIAALLLVWCGVGGYIGYAAIRAMRMRRLGPASVDRG